MAAEDESRSVLSAFAYIGVLTSYFAAGLAFVFLVGPLLYSWNSRLDLGTLSGFLSLWPDSWCALFAASLTIPAAFAYTVLILLLGFSIQPFATTAVNTSGRIAFKVFPSLFKLAGVGGELYSQIGTTPKLAPLSDRLQRHQSAKAAWQWEFFHYYTACGLAFNAAALWLVLLVRMLWQSVSAKSFVLSSYWPVLLSFVFVVNCLLHAWARSQSQKIITEYYYKKAANEW